MVEEHNPTPKKNFLPIPAYLAGILLCIAVMVGCGVFYFHFQNSLRELESGLLRLQSRWYSLLISVQSLRNTTQPMEAAYTRFHQEFQDFQERLAREKALMGDWEKMDSDLGQRFQKLSATLDQGLDEMKELDTWLSELARIKDLSVTRFVLPPPGSEDRTDDKRARRFLEWSLQRIEEFDMTSGTIMRLFSDNVNNLTDDHIRSISRRSYLITLVAALTCAAAFLLFLLRLRSIGKTLARQSRQLEEANAHLEENVSQRTAHLTQTLTQLQEAQSQIVRSEKLAVLGNLAAGMAHELNTPLAAIQSGAATIRTFFHERLEIQLLRFLERTPQERQILFELVRSSLTKDPGDLMNTRPYRERQEFAGRLNLAGAREPETQAVLWQELGLMHHQPLWSAYAAHEHILAILEQAAEFTAAAHMASLIEFSTVKANYVVSTMRNYLDGNSKEEESVFALKPELETILSLFSPQQRRNLLVQWKLPADLLIRGSVHMLSQVWLNLINNALQAMEFQGHLVLEGYAEAENAVFRIIDSGTGISAESKERIFEPFYTTKKQTGGLGLGLDISKRIVEKHGGEIRFESRPGRTVFEVRLPTPSRN